MLRSQNLVQYIQVLVALKLKIARTYLNRKKVLLLCHQELRFKKIHNSENCTYEVDEFYIGIKHYVTRVIILYENNRTIAIEIN